jgi:hypothetical protein
MATQHFIVTISLVTATPLSRSISPWAIAVENLPKVYAGHFMFARISAAGAIHEVPIVQEPHSPSGGVQQPCIVSLGQNVHRLVRNGLQRTIDTSVLIVDVFSIQ